MPFEVLSLSNFDKVFLMFWLVCTLVILMVGVLLALGAAAVCYKIVVAKFASRQPRNKTTRQTKSRARRAQRAKALKSHQPMIPEVRHLLLGL